MRRLFVLLALCLAALPCLAAPTITFTNLGPTCSTADRTLLNVSIFDGTGVPTSGANVPRIYYRKNTGAWFSQPGTFVSGNTNNSVWSFTIVTADLGALAVNDVVQYYVIAQNTAATPSIASRPAGAVATSVNAVTTPPSAPASYSIGATLNGNYTVGAGGDYATLNAAISAYSNGCLSGPVVFNLTDASYTVSGQQSLINADASATNTLTIKPASGVDAAITGSVGGAMFRITGSYITIDGNNGSAGRHLSLTNNAGSIAAILSVGFSTTTNVNIQNANLVSASASSTLVQISDANDFTSMGYFRNIHVNNNSFQRAYMGINAYIGQGGGFGTGVEFRNNDLSASGTNALLNVGIQLTGADGALITGNTIGNFNGNADESDVAIQLGNGALNTIVENNKIDNLVYTGSAGRGAQGIRINTGLANSGVKVRNNFISNISGDGYNTAVFTGDPVGILAYGNQGGLTIAHNSIYLAGNTLNQTGAFSAGIYLTSGTSASVVNNIILNNLGIKPGASTGSFGPLGALGIYAETAGLLTATGNVYYVAPTGVGVKDLGRIGGTGYTAIAAWQTASGETNARNVLPVFTSASDLHLVPASNGLLDNTGSVSGLATDIDGDARSATTPDPGADEFSGPCVAPVIATQPAAAAACPGANASFSVTATGSGISYQWRKGGANIAGATSATYTITGVTSTDAATYDVVITGACGNVTSSAVALTLNAAPVITNQPSAQTACPGANVTFTVVATGTDLTYQWRKGGTNISGATGATLTLNGITAADAANYDVVVSGACSPSVTSTTAALQVTAAPTITTQPAAQTICNGANASLTVAATGTGLTYEWSLGSTVIPGATSATLSLTNLTSTGIYTVKVTNGCGLSTTSSPATITVNAATVISTQPQGASLCPGASTTLSVTATGTSLTYQWRKGGTNISGATSSSYTISNISAADAAAYDVVMTGTCGTLTSTAATIALNSVPSISTQPSAQTACLGGSATFSVTAAGTGITYQWRKGGANISGATGSSYTISNITAADAANYDVVVSGTCTPSITSNAVALALNTVNSWLGTVSSDWSNASNWCLGVPTATSDITIASGTPNSPSITTTATVHNLTINTGATVTIAAGGRLDMTGSLTPNGTLAAASGTIAFTGTAAQTTGVFTAKKLIVNGAGLTLNGNVTADTLSLVSGQLTLGNNNLTLNSSSTGSVASHVIVNGTGSVISNNIGATPVEIPVAPDAASYNAVIIANGGARNYTVRVATGINPAIANAARAVNRTWTVQPNTTPTSNANVTFQFADADANTGAGTTGIMEVGAHNGSTWVIVSGSGATPTGTSAARQVSIATTQFGPMVVTSPGGITYPTAVSSVIPDLELAQLLPSVVQGDALLRVSLRRAAKLDLTVRDANGRQVFGTGRSFSAGTTDQRLDLSRLAAGSYYLELANAKGKTVIRFVKL